MSRCFIGALGLSAVVGGITLGIAQNHYEAKEQKLREIAFNACLDLGPPSDQREPKALEAQLQLCNYGRPDARSPRS